MNLGCALVWAVKRGAYVVREVGVHDDHEGAGAEVEAVDVGCAEAELAGARLEDLGVSAWSGWYLELALEHTTHNLVLAVRLGQLPRNVLRAIWARVVDDDDLPVEATDVSCRDKRIAPRQ